MKQQTTETSTSSSATFPLGAAETTPYPATPRLRNRVREAREAAGDFASYPFDARVPTAAPPAFRAGDVTSVAPALGGAKDSPTAGKRRATIRYVANHAMPLSLLGLGAGWLLMSRTTARRLARLGGTTPSRSAASASPTDTPPSAGAGGVRAEAGLRSQ
jgi:hypothetical protein